jgi:anti-sigma B factor antagonist
MGDEHVVDGPQATPLIETLITRRLHPDVDGDEPPFSLAVEVDGATTVLTVSGEFDLSARVRVDDFSARLPYLPRHLVLDMLEVGFMDSAGLQALMEMRAAVVAIGGDLVIRAPSAQVRRLLEITALGELLLAHD